jgi:hypothetical protein
MNKMKTYLVAVTVSLAMGACLSEAPEQIDEEDNTSVQISASTSQCHDAVMCFWRHNGFAGTFKGLTASQSNFEDIDLGDEVTSVWNRTTVAWVLYQHDTFRGDTACLHPGASVANLGNFNFNDEISSARRQTSDTCPSGAIVFSGMN